ncbi:extracellular solute-binding protein [Brachybacterium saurashtrense]|uniref:Extracellular solute-binding protein n=1 Tax=Brachybacterium saurashtrense TaxID=556288 RepID=A0A345YTC1_9MICO|nr:extracellular solute-binding protein [Brachybacterium saurashtrense]AXK47173.1 extracellular solute-binding protein [Brachybacterium saurashtrense]RRR21795.1 extracellular solute-binding protein [Brachybacterium saurashtrense]
MPPRPSVPRQPARRSILRFTAGVAVAVPLSALAGCAAGGSRDPHTIRIAYQQFGSGTIKREWITAAAQEFSEENPELTVQLVPIVASENDYFTKNELLMSSPRTSPDLVYEDSFILLSDMGAGYLQPMTDLIDRFEHWDDIADASKDAVTGEDGEVYGVPITTDTRALWYQREVFAEAGLPEDWQPGSWEEILDAARAIRDSDSEAIPLFLFAGTPQGEKASMQGFEMLLYGTGDGTGLYDREAERWILGAQGFIDALGFLRTLFEEDLTATLGQHLDPNIAESIYTTMLPEAKLGILLDGSWISQNWTDSAARPWPEWPDVVGLADMPTQDGSGSGTVTLAGGWGLSIPTHATDRETAFRFLEKLVSTPTLVQYAIADNHITVRADVAEDEEYLGYSPAVEYFTDLLETAYYRPALPAYPEVSSAIQEAMEAVMTGTSPEAAAAAYDATVTEIVGPEHVQEASA